MNEAKEIDPESKWSQLADYQDIASFHGAFFNVAAASYNEQDFEKFVLKRTLFLNSGKLSSMDFACCK